MWRGNVARLASKCLYDATHLPSNGNVEEHNRVVGVCGLNRHCRDLPAFWDNKMQRLAIYTAIIWTTIGAVGTTASRERRATDPFCGQKTFVTKSAIVRK